MLDYRKMFEVMVEHDGGLARAPIARINAQLNDIADVGAWYGLGRRHDRPPGGSRRAVVALSAAADAETVDGEFSGIGCHRNRVVTF